MKQLLLAHSKIQIQMQKEKMQNDNAKAGVSLPGRNPPETAVASTPLPEPTLDGRRRLLEKGWLDSTYTIGRRRPNFFLGIGALQRS